MSDFPAPPCDFGLWRPHQYEAMLNVIAGPGGMAAIVAYAAAVRARVAKCQECRLNSARTVRQVMACTRGGYPGIDQADLLPITRGLLNSIFSEEHPV